MVDETKKPEEETGDSQPTENQKTQEEESEEKPEGQKPEGESKDDSSKADFAKEELKKAKALLAKKDKSLIKAHRKIEHLEKPDEEEPEKETDEEKENKIREVAADAVKKETANLQKNLLKREAKAIARRLAGDNEDMVELIMLHYENSITPTDNLEDDVENAYFIANKKRLKQQISSRQAGEATGAGSGAGQKQPPKPKQPSLTPTEKKIIEGSDIKFDEKKQKLVSPAKEKFKKKHSKFFPE